MSEQPPTGPGEPGEPGEVWIDYVRLDDLAGADRNARTHDLDAITESVIQLGFTTAGRIDERTGQLVRGHGRLAVLRRLRDRGAQAPEGIHDLDDDWAMPIERGWSSRHDRHADAVALADNAIAQTGGFDERVLYDQLADLAADAPGLLRAAGYDAADLDRLLESVGQRPDGATVTDLDGLGAALAPWDQPAGDPFADRPTPPERGSDEQWDVGQTVVDPEDRPPRPGAEQPPGPLDVAPAWRTLQPYRAAFHAGGDAGARAVLTFLRGHVHGTAVDPTSDVVTWGDRDGTWELPPGQWVTRDGQTGRFDIWTATEFADRFVPANEPARRVQRGAENSTVNARPARENGEPDGQVPADAEADAAGVRGDQRDGVDAPD